MTSTIDPPLGSAAVPVPASLAARPIPSPKAWPLLGHLPYLSKGKHGCFYDSLARIAKIYRPIFQLKIAGQTWYCVTDGTFAKDLLGARKRAFPKGKTLNELRAFGLGGNGLTFSEGDAWMAQRKMLAPQFMPANLTDFTAKLPKHIDRFCELIGTDSTVEILNAMSRLAMASLFDVFASEPTGCLDDLASVDPLIARQLFATQQLVVRIKRTPLWKYLPIPTNFRVCREVAAQERFLLGLVAKRRSAKTPPADLMTFLLSAAGKPGAPATDRDLIDQLQTFLGASYESVSVCLHWLFYLLAEHPQVEARLLQELTAFDAAHPDAKPADYTKIEYLQHVLKETMRIRPVFPFIGREVAEDEEMDGYRLKKGSVIFFLTEVMQTDPEIWGPAAGEFRPERFATGETKKGELTSYYPFGIGNRYCIGNHLAMQMMSLVAARLIRTFKFSVVPGQDPSPFYRFSWGSLKGINMRLTRR